MPTVTELLTTSAAVTGGVIGGFYTAFGIVVMPALDKTGAQPAGRSMVAINEVAETPPFLTLFGLATISSGAAAVMSLREGDAVAAVGASLILAGTLTTVVFNVPMNRALAAGSASWESYRQPWGLANGLRAVASIVGAALLSRAGG